MGAALTADVWWAEASWFRPWHLDVLSDEEQDRAGSYRQESDRARFVVAATLLRFVVGARIGVEPRLVPVARRCAHCGGPHGQPVITGIPLGVSVAHAGRLVVVATISGGAVGVDVEQVRDLDFDALLPMVRSPVEARSSLTREDFFRAWVRKEAVLKCIGTGLDLPMTAVTLSRRCHGTRKASISGWLGPRPLLVDLDANPDHAASLAAIDATGGQHETPAALEVNVHRAEAAELVRVAVKPLPRDPPERAAATSQPR